MFKECPCCGHQWSTQYDLLSDPDVKLIGYQADFENLLQGLIYLDHSCGTTMAMEVAQFTNLVAGPVFMSRATGTEECPGYCLKKDELRRCPTECECAYIREVLDTIKTWPKSAASDGLQTS